MNTLQKSLRAARACLNGFLLLLLLAALPGGPPAYAASPDVVISQVYGGGGAASGNTFRSDYIELYNLGSAPVSLSGWSVQYASSAGSTWQATALSGVIGPGEYYLIQEAGGSAGAALPAPDATGSLTMSMTDGKVALVRSTAALSGSCPTGGAIADFLGYGSANCAEGSPTPALSKTSAALRKGEGGVDTDRNSLDFTVGAPNPRSRAYSLAPKIAWTSPAANATGIAPDASITIAFSEPVTVSAGWAAVRCTTSGAHPAAESGGPATYTMTPASPFQPAERCTISVDAAKVADQDNPPHALWASADISFYTVSPARIHDIQGAGHRSPREGLAVDDVPGVVTAVRGNGFTIQDPNPDGDPATSEGIFVYTTSAPFVLVGDAVLVSGIVSEYRPEGEASANVSTTEITSRLVKVQSPGSPLPAPVVIGQGGRVPPDQVIEDDANGDVETGGVFDPISDGLDFFESLEGMRVQVNDARVVGPTNLDNELPVVADGGGSAGLLTPRGGIVVRQDDFNPERIILHSSTAMPMANTGDAISEAVVGVIDYSNGHYRLEVSQPPAVVSGGLTQETAPQPGPLEISIATFNVENLSAADPPEKFAALAELIVDHLRAPDILAVEEIQDNNGAGNDGTVAADQTYARFLQAIAAAGGPDYQYRQIDPRDGQDGGEPGGNIRVGFLYRPDRGLRFVDRPGADALTANSVVSGAGGVHLAYSPGRIAPGSPAFSGSRKPLAAEFTYRQQRLFVIANHFNSKSDDPLFGRYQPPRLSSEAKRIQQAQVVHDFVAQILALDAHAQVVVLGDLNDTQFSNPLKTLKGSPAVLHDLIETLPANEQYTYVYEGNAQVLDHILTSGALFNRAFQYDAVHVNAEFAQPASDHDPQVLILPVDRVVYLPLMLK